MFWWYGKGKSPDCGVFANFDPEIECPEMLLVVHTKDVHNRSCNIKSCEHRMRRIVSDSDALNGWVVNVDSEPFLMSISTKTEFTWLQL